MRDKHHSRSDSDLVNIFHIHNTKSAKSIFCQMSMISVLFVYMTKHQSVLQRFKVFIININVMLK